MTPSPRRVSLELLTRTTFQPATILNVIAAAWIQFMVHDWFVHKKGTWSFTHDIPLDDGDTWHERPMRVPKTPADAPKVDGSTRPPAYINENTHWWDGSHVYGSSPASQASLRAGREGKVLVSPSGRLGVDPVTGREITGFTENGWVGLSLLHALFALEHNAICDTLKKHNPKWDDERLFQQARLVNAALLAKIHTVEWSTAILPNDVTVDRPAGELVRPVQQAAERVSRSSRTTTSSRGIPGSPTEHHGVPFTLTEEFVSVYRMHPLMPDHFTIKSAKTGEGLANAELPELLGRRGVEFLGKFELGRSLLLVRHPQSRRRPAAQLSEVPAEPGAGQRRALRHRHHRHPARPRTRRAPLQPLPAAAEQATGQELRGADRRARSGPRRSSASTTTTSRRSTRWSA